MISCKNDSCDFNSLGTCIAGDTDIDEDGQCVTFFTAGQRSKTTKEKKHET